MSPRYVWMEGFLFLVIRRLAASADAGVEGDWDKWAASTALNVQMFAVRAMQDNKRLRLNSPIALRPPAL